MTGNNDLNRRLNRLLVRRRLWIAAIAIVIAVGVGSVAAVVLQTPQDAGTERATVIGRVVSPSENRVIYSLNVEFSDGARRTLTVPATSGIVVGDSICIQRLRNPLLGTVTLRRAPEERCAR
ncbi:MAG: hypothetical protein AAFY80_11210 [Pseudomonadota bacterium]